MMMSSDYKWSSCVRCPVLISMPTLLLLLLVASAGAQQQQAPTTITHPTEVKALNAVYTKLQRPWYASDNPCAGAVANIDDPTINQGITCDCSYQNNTVCHITKLKMFQWNVVGPIPEELRKLTYLTNLNLQQNYLTGPLPSFLGQLTALQYMVLSANALTGPIPKELGNLVNLKLLGLSTNNLTGSLPYELGNLVNLEQLYIDSAGISGPIPSSFANPTRMKKLYASDNDFVGRIPDYIGSWSNLTDFNNNSNLAGNSFQGPLPTTLSNLVQLTNLRIGDIVNGSSTLAFISNMTSLNFLILRNCKISDTLASVNFSQFVGLTLLDLSFNNITGHVSQSLVNLNSLTYLFIGNNSLSGSLPTSIGHSLKNLDFSYNQLSGNFPSWTRQNLQLNLVANNFVIYNSNDSLLSRGLECLQRDTPCFLGSTRSTSFAIDCGSNKSINASDNIMYQPDDANLGVVAYYVSRQLGWGVSNVGRFMDASNGSYVISSSNQFHNTYDSELFKTARMSPSSLRYYGVGLENGEYTVTLQFAEFDFEDSQTWKSLGKRVFDIYLQGELKEQNFDIRKKARESSEASTSYTVIKRQYIIPVTRNFMEIHLFWAGKGTCCVPHQGYYGPTISALSATLNAPKKGSKIGVIVAAVVFTTVLGLVFAGIYFWRCKRRNLSLEDKELYNIVGRPNIFSYSYGELRTAVENFSSNNLLGEGGYGSVYKGKLNDGSMVAVKQLSETSRQGKMQFVAEIETISRVQHRNLVKLHGCCLDGNKPLLVYEYMENGSLDKALFGSGKMDLDWPTRYEICLGIARGIAYLHEESSIRVVHRDIKASNVLLDGNLKPKISDFGLAKLYDNKKTHVSTRVAGTFGYLAPEYAMRGHMTEKVDVFAFGVVVLEIIAGRPNFNNNLDDEIAYLLESVWQLYEEDHPLDVVDPRLTEFNSKEVLCAIRVALLCIQSSPRQRPSMSRVVSMLAGDSEVTEVLSKPSYVTEWQMMNTSSGQSSSAPTVDTMSTTTSPFLSSIVDESE